MAVVSRLIQMVNFILSRTFDGDEENWGDARQRIGEMLDDHGYDPAEIAMALDVALQIRQRLRDDEYFPLPIYTNRLYQYLEEVRLTTEARGYLTRLLHENVISPEQYQQVVERSLLLDTLEVGLEEIRAITDDLLGDEGEFRTGPDTDTLFH